MQIKDIYKMNNSEIARYYYELSKFVNPEKATVKAIRQILTKANTDEELNRLLTEADNKLLRELEK